MFNLDPKRIDARNPLASGSFGTIHAYLDSDKNTENKDWVVKRIPAKDTKELKFFMQEAVLGFNHRHPFVVSNRGYDIKDVRNEKGEPAGWDIFIKMPRMDKSLKKAIGNHLKAKPPTKPTLSDIIKHFYSVASGLEYLQGKRIIHNNVNPGTILVDKDSVAKIGGIGLAQHKPWKEGGAGSGTRLYTAPERLDKKIVPEKETAFKGDVWSLGVSIIEFCLLGKVKRYYPETDDDWLGVDSEESKPQEEEKAPEKEKKVNEDDLNLNKEEVKINDERKMEPGAFLIEENLKSIQNQYGEPDTKKLINILRKTLILNPKMRISFTGICQELEDEFPLELKDISSIKNDQSKYEQEVDENSNLFFYGDTFLEDEEESSHFILSSNEESLQAINNSNFSVTQEKSINPKAND